MKSLKQYLNTSIKERSLSSKESNESLTLLLSEKTSAIQKGAFLTALAARGETAEEVLAIAKALQKQMIVVPQMSHALDIVGTGGDGYDTINVSTLSVFVCAYLGVPVAKHGNRALSSKCGSFDLLETMGVSIPKNPKEATKFFNKNKIVFLFAPNFHPALKKLHPLRRELGIRTIFNFVGPILSPANTSHQIIGVSSSIMARKIGQVLIGLGRKRILVVHSRDGLDEVSVSAQTDVYDYAKGRSMKHFIIKPSKYYPIDSVKGGTPKQNVKIFKDILGGKGTPAQNEFVALNTALGLYAYGEVTSIEKGRTKALKAIESGNIIKLLDRIRDK